MVVIDTSVALKWFLNEEGSEVALALLKKENLAAPDLLLYEITNALVCKRALKPSDIQDLLKLLFQFQIQLFVLPQERFFRVAELCRNFKITAYDASFIALAEVLKADFITADRKLAQCVPSLGFVKALSSL